MIAAVLASRVFTSPVPVQTVTIESPAGANGTVLNASGYVVARRLATVAAELNVAASGAEAQRRNLREIEVRLADAQRMFERNRSLVESKLVAQSAFDTSAALQRRGDREGCATGRDGLAAKSAMTNITLRW